ncbi:MAG: hypothetical protein H6707_07275 [Deltaproteobacteria bacterium]|nr:hypothetical protein [Deltaproteobacteria bacterium]
MTRLLPHGLVILLLSAGSAGAMPAAKPKPTPSRHERLSLFLKISSEALVRHGPKRQLLNQLSAEQLGLQAYRSRRSWQALASESDQSASKLRAFGKLPRLIAAQLFRAKANSSVPLLDHDGHGRGVLEQMVSAFHKAGFKLPKKAKQAATKIVAATALRQSAEKVEVDQLIGLAELVNHGRLGVDARQAVIRLLDGKLTEFEDAETSALYGKGYIKALSDVAGLLGASRQQRMLEQLSFAK